MSNFVTDNTTLSFPKTNRDPLAGGDDPTKFIAAPEWNAVCQAAYDLRGATPKYTSGDPNGVLAGAKGDIARDTANGAIWVNTTGGSVWKKAMIGDTAVTPGSYAPAAITVDQQGRVTAASNAAISGRLLNTQVLTAASGTYTPTSGTTYASVRMAGGGAGSGGVPTCSGNQSAAGGGAGGAYVEFTVGTLGGAALTGGAYAIGAAGTAGTTAPTAGGNGGDTTIVINSTTFTAKGGLGGAAGAAGAATSFAAGGAVQAGSSSRANQEAGDPGINVNNLIFYGGKGGRCGNLGSGGPIGVNGNAGTAGTGNGAGGGGPCTNGTARAGAAGTAGIIIIEERS